MSTTARFPVTRPLPWPQGKSRIIRPPWPQTLLVNTAEGGSNGTTITTGNTGGASGNAATSVTTAGAVAIFDASKVAHGTLSYQFSTSTSAQAFFEWSSGVGPIPRCFGGFYVNASAFTTVPSLARLRGNGAATQNIRISLDATGHVQVRGTGNTVLATSTNPLVVGSWARIEWDVIGGPLGTANVYIYLAADAAVGAHTELVTVTGVDLGPGTIDDISFGIVASTVSASAFNLDNFNVNSTALPGPAAPDKPPVQTLVGGTAPVGWGLAATGAQIFAAPVAQVVVSATASPQPLVVVPGWPQWPVPQAAQLFAAAQATPGTVPLLVGPDFAWPQVPPPLISASQPLGNPAVPTPQVLLVTPPTPLVLVPPVHFSTNTPLGNPAVPTPGPLVVGPPPAPPLLPRPTLSAGSATTASGQPLVVGPPFAVVPVPGALISSNPAAPPVVAVGTPAPLVVTPPWQPVPIPVPQISASQPLGNPAVGTAGPIVVSTPFAAKVPGAQLFGPGAPTAAIVTGSTPGPLVVGPPFAPVPVPQVYLSASQPLGNPATSSPQPLVVGPGAARPHRIPPAWITSGPAGAASSTPQPLVIGPAFTLAPVPGARVFAAPSAPATPSVPTPGPLVVGPPWRHVSIPKAYLSASYPLGNPAVGSPQPMVVTPPHRWPHRTPVLLSTPFGVMVSCSTSRPGTGTTARPASGTTAYALAMTSRPSSGTTARPNTGITDDPC